MIYIIILASFFIIYDLKKRFFFNNPDKSIKELMKNRKFNLASNKNTKSYRTEEKLLKKANVNISVEDFQVMKIISSLVVLVLSFTILISYQGIKRAEILNHQIVQINIISNFIGGEDDVEKEDVFLTELTKEANENLEYEKIIKGGEYEELQNQVVNLVSDKIQDKEQILMYSEEVYYNLIKLNDTKLKSINIILVFLFSLGFLNLPKLIVRLKASAMEAKMEEELNKLEIFTLLLLKKDNTNIYQIIAKLYERSDVFKPYLLKCLNDYQRDGKRALEDMQEEVDFKPFTDFINILKQGIDTNRKTTANVLEISRRLRNNIRISQLKDKNKRKHRNIIILRFPMIIMGIYMLVLPLLIILRENM